MSKLTHLPDIDIDIADRDKLLKHFTCIPASIHKDGNVVKHNTGVYFTPIPFDGLHNVAAFDHKEAERLGYFKLDMLNVSVYELVKDEAHKKAMLAREPTWELLWTDPEFVGKLLHIGSYYNLLCQMRPDTVARMAMFLAVIRPAKRHLIGKPWKEIAETVWDKPEGNEYYFKKAHSVGYAHLVKMHMNLLETI